MLWKIINFFKYLYYFILTLPRDIKSFGLLRKIKQKTLYYDEKNYSVQDVFGEWARSQPEKACIIFNSQTWTFQDVIY